MDFFKLLAKPFLSLALPAQKQAHEQEELLSQPHDETRKESALHKPEHLSGFSAIEPLGASNSMETVETTGGGMLQEVELIPSRKAEAGGNQDSNMEASCSSTYLPSIHYSSTSYPLHPLPLRPNTNPPLTSRTSELSYELASSSTTLSSTRPSALSSANSTFNSQLIGNHSAGLDQSSRRGAGRGRSPSPSTQSRRSGTRRRENVLGRGRERLRMKIGVVEHGKTWERGAQESAGRKIISRGLENIEEDPLSSVEGNTTTRRTRLAREAHRLGETETTTSEETEETTLLPACLLARFNDPTSTVDSSETTTLQGMVVRGREVRFHPGSSDEAEALPLVDCLLLPL